MSRDRSGSRWNPRGLAHAASGGCAASSTPLDHLRSDATPDFIDQTPRAIDLVQRFEQRRRVHRDRAVGSFVKAVVAAQLLDVAVEYKTDDFALAVDHR